MKILIVGNGGREHALLWKLRHDVPNADFYITRGNGGTAGLATSLPIDATDVRGLTEWAAENGVDLTIVGPEGPLAEGIADSFSARGLNIFGPSALAAELESSKAFAKGLMLRHGIPTARYEVFTEAEAALAHVRREGAPIVVKASGLAAGKGAVVCLTVAEAEDAIREMTSGAFGTAGDKIVIEEFMEGEELSVFALTDGESVQTLLAAQDHKRIGEGDTGPNTGGMGAYAPVSIATPQLLLRIEQEILIPTVRAMALEGRTYRGIVYAGLMLTSEGPKVVEFNCRFGDPEAQVILPLMESSLLEPLLAIAQGQPLAEVPPVEWRDAAAVTTVIASQGYPGPYTKGVSIEIPDDLESPDLVVFHAGTTRDDTGLKTSGGRVLAVTAMGGTVGDAARRSRDAAARIEIEGSSFRRDIGWREIERIEG